MEMHSMVTSLLFFLVVLAFLADLGGGDATAIAPYSSLDWQQGTKNTGSAIADSKRARRGHWGEKCSKRDIQISQAPTAPLPSGIPTYTVEISNTCVSGCNISHIHLNCGWFSSARLRYNDCLVNDGKPLLPGRIISFQYATTFPHTLTVSTVVCKYYSS